MRLLLYGILVFSWLELTEIKPLRAQVSTTLQKQAENKVFYTYYNKKVPLILQENIFTAQNFASYSGEQEYLEQKTYTEEPLPVLSSQYKTEDEVILPSEIIVSFDEELPQSRRKSILQKHNLKIIRKLRFSENRYLVKATSISGTSILNIANRLYQVNGVKSATPNFIMHSKSNTQ